MPWWRRSTPRKAFESELDAEIRFDVATRVTHYRRSGVSASEARRRALVELGGLDQIKEHCRDARGTRWMTEIVQDVRMAARMLVRDRGLTLAVVCTVGLGVGATAAIFSVAYGVLWRPLPYADPRTLVVVQVLPNPPTATSPSLTRVSAVELPDWIQRTRTFTSLALYNEDVFSVTGETGQEAVLGSYVSPGFFEALGEPMVLGQPPHDAAARTVVVSYRFGNDDSVETRWWWGERFD